MLSEVRAASERVERVLSTLEVDALDGALAADYVAVFAKLERVAAAGKTLAARRVVETASWRRRGAHRGPAEWMAEQSGTSVGQACSVLDTAERVAALPATEAALRSGALSTQQAALLVDAASADPHAERHLLQRAGPDGVTGLRAACGRVKAAARDDEVAHHQRIHAARSLRSYTDRDGAGCVEIRGPLDATARIIAALKPLEQELFELARERGVEERPAALRFDALVLLAERGGPSDAGDTGHTCAPAAQVAVHVDHAALVRGRTEPGEVCELVGIGPVPVAVVSQMLDDAFVKVLVIDGTDVRSVSHIGRLVGARLRSAVEERCPECAIAGCHVTEHLEIDHNVPVEVGGPTAMWNLSRLCGHHHRHKHLYDLRLAGTGTDRCFVPADRWTPPERGP